MPNILGKIFEQGRKEQCECKKEAPKGMPDILGKIFEQGSNTWTRKWDGHRAQKGMHPWNIGITDMDVTLKQA